jgi:hypothetical protein
VNCNAAAAAAAAAGALQWGLKRTHKSMGESLRSAVQGARDLCVVRSPSPWWYLLSTAPKNVFGAPRVHFQLNWPT